MIQPFFPALLGGDMSEPTFCTSQDGRIHGVYVYVSLFSGNVTEKAREFLPGTRRVYNFKRYGRGSRWVVQAVGEASSQFGCEAVMVVPGSTPDNTSLQTVFGVSIRRVTAVPRRKYSHASPIPAGYAGTVEFPAVVPNRVLLLDDVCTSGRTLRWFGQALRMRGAEPVLFCLGLNRRLTALDNVSASVAGRTHSRSQTTSALSRS